MTASSRMIPPYSIDVMNDISLEDDKYDSISPSMIYVPMGGDSIKSHDMSCNNNSRDMIEKRRRRQAKEAVEMLGIMESISDDDESYVNDTLASLEYSTTTAGSSPSFLKELVETTAPYTSSTMPQWQFFIRKWHRRISQNRNLQRYGPWMAMLLVYASCKMAWQPSGASHRSTGSTTDSTTLKVYHNSDSVLDRLQPNSVPLLNLVDDSAAPLNRGIFQPPMAETRAPIAINSNHRMQKQLLHSTTSLAPDNAMDEDPILEQKELQQRKQYHVETSLKMEEDPMALPPPGKGGTTDPNFQQRFNTLKQISQRDQAVSLKVDQQQQQQVGPQQQQKQQQQHQHQQRQPAAVQVPPSQQQVLVAKEGTSDWQPRKRGDNKVEPANLRSAGSV